IIVAVLGLVVVNALKSSPWGTVTIALTIPIAMFMGLYMRFVRPDRVLETTAIGIVMLVLALYAGRWVAENPSLAPMFTLSGTTLAVCIMIYGFAASVLPVWLLLAPRDYLSAFVKIGVVVALAAGILVVMPPFQMPALTRFTDGTGPVFAGKVFPFAFITLACGSISGFHALVASGTTPKLIAVETDARMIGFGAMLMESFVAVMALIAACVLTPGVYFAINAPPSAIGTTFETAAVAIQNWGFAFSAADFATLTRNVGETSLLSRTGGAPSLAVGMAHIFSSVFGGTTAMALWYHFAIMFEALFILTTLDAGTRVGRFLLQDLVKHVWTPLGRTGWYPAVIFTSALFVALWGYFLYQGVVDPLGGINSLWPLFGIANQLLATVALCVGTSVIIKMGKARFAFTTLVPMVWLVSVTMTAGYQKIFSPQIRLGFLAHAKSIQQQVEAGVIPTGVRSLSDGHRLIINDWINAGIAGFFLAAVVAVLAFSAYDWMLLVTKRKPCNTTEVPFEPVLIPS
ncbi:MAG: carbon starvation protein A, partial [Gemmatimonadaceae bacterium]|nr:carbon starvation protein A [Gemmatimonadaceae bacterium]